MGIIYLAINMQNEKMYIGKTELTLDKRIQAHYKKAKANRVAGNIETHFHRALLKYSASTIQWSIIDESDDSNELNRLERYWIQLMKEKGFDLYNQTTGGDGLPKGFKHTAISIQKMSDAKRGKLGKPQSIASKNKIGAANAKTYTLVSPDGIAVEFNNMREFCRTFDLDQSAMVKVANGKAKSHKGWTREE